MGEALQYIKDQFLNLQSRIFQNYSQLNKAVLTPPICKGPVGDGANLVATFYIKNV